MGIEARLKFLSFLQYFIWGSWLITLGSYMIKTLSFSGTQVGNIYSTQGVAACIMPLLLGIIADKYITANRLYALCHGIGGVMLIMMAHITNPHIMLWVMLLNLMAYMPTIGLANAIMHFCIQQKGLDTAQYFPAIRVFGTIGFIAAMWGVSLLGLELSALQLYFAAAASFAAALYGLTLPALPAGAGAEPGAAKQSLTQRMGLDALALLKQPRMAVFFGFACALGVVLHITNTFGNPFLHDLAGTPAGSRSLLLRYPDILYSLSQISEIIFILAIPFFLKKFGIKKVMLISVAAWVLRFGFFAFGGADTAGMGLLILSMLVYGCAFDFFMISGSIFVEKEVGHSMRAGGQGLFLTAVNGLGTFIGMYFVGRIIDYFTIGGARDWQAIWLVFAVYSAALFIVFWAIFREKNESKSGE